MKYYIAYGSNLSVEQMAHRCPDARIVGKATIKDYKLVFRLHATIEPEPGSTVPVLIWSISQRDEERLDRYEGVPTYYEKQLMPVNVTPLSGGKSRKITGMVYIMCIGRPLIPPRLEYNYTILNGYRRFGFNSDKLLDAYSEAFMSEPPAM